MVSIITPPTEGYELIDTGNGLRLERFGQHTVVRPDSSVLWKPTNPQHPAWINPDARFAEEAEGHWVLRKPGLREGWEARFGAARVLVKPTAFRHVGVFPEQAANWDWLEGRIQDTKKPVKVLNLFGYTGIASVVAAAAGAQVTHVDASKGTVFWASENARRSGLGEKGIRWIVDDVQKFVARELRRGTSYDLIIMDPPVFGRGSKGEIWRLEDNLAELLGAVQRLFTKEPLGFLLNFYATPLYPEALLRLVQDTVGTVVPGCALASLCVTESESKKPFQCGFSVRSHF